MKLSLKVKAVIFDRDGVIIDSEDIFINSKKFAFNKLGYGLQEEDIQQLIGRGFIEYKNYFLEKWDFDQIEFRKIQRGNLHENLGKAQYYQETLHLIRKLSQNSIPMAVTTSAQRAGTILILEKAGLTNLFSVIVSAEDVKKSKPDPEPYLLTAQKLGIEPKYCLAIEDTASGVQAAKAAGMLCIAIPNKYTYNQDFSKADAVVKSAKEIEGMLELPITNKLI